MSSKINNKMSNTKIKYINIHECIKYILFFIYIYTYTCLQSDKAEKTVQWHSRVIIQIHLQYDKVL